MSLANHISRTADASSKTQNAAQQSLIDEKNVIHLGLPARTPEHKQIKQEILDELQSDLVSSSAAPADIEVSKHIAQLVSDKTADIFTTKEQRIFSQEIFDDVKRLGPIQKIMDMPGVSDIVINRGGEQVYVDRGGNLYLTDMQIDKDELSKLIDRIAANANRHVDEAHPTLDCVLEDGSRCNVAIPPMSIDGAAISIRRFPDKPLEINDLTKGHMLNTNMAKFLQLAVRGRNSIVVSGGTSTGKTTLLNVLSNFIPLHERIITIEDAAELRLHSQDLVRLEAKDANAEGRGEITIRECVKNTLRMRPDRIIIGECRSDEIVDMLQAMNTGHEGSLTTIHANSVHDCLGRIETMFLMAGVDMPIEAIRRQIVSAIQLIVQIERASDGSRHITDIAEITGMEGNTISSQSLFKYEHGRHVATGMAPQHVAEQALKSGIQFPPELFQVRNISKN